MTIHLISSLNKKLYSEYGQRFICEFLENKREGISLTVVFEDGVPDSANGLEGINLLELEDSRHYQFMNKFGKLYEANGVRILRKQNASGTIDLNITKSFQFDAVRFSFKIFSLSLAFDTLPRTDDFAWIDADMRCIAPFSESDIEPFMPKKREIMSYLNRTHYPLSGAYSECGFLGFNNKSKKLKPFLDRMESLYLTGEIFTKKQWHDSWLWDDVRREFEANGSEFLNLASGIDHFHHPFINTGLGKFFDHLKGPKRKALGHSLEDDYET